MALDHATAATPRRKRALLTGRNIILQFPYLPRHEYARGLAAGLLDATYPLDYEDYLRTVESALRSHARESRVVLVTLTIDDLLVFAARTGRNPARRSTRLACISGRRYGSPAPWPPERNATCWCGSRIKYKKCCGRPGFAEAAIPDRARFLLRVDATVPGVPRKVRVPSELSADKLHRALAEAIGRDGDQPRYRFEIEGRHVLDARMEDEDGIQTADQVTVSMLASEPGQSFRYQYDYADGRPYTVTIEDVVAVDPADNDVLILNGGLG